MDPQDLTTAGAVDVEREVLTPLEQEVLDEYARIIENLNNVSFFPLTCFCMAFTDV
jgi:hypothetical protein